MALAETLKLRGRNREVGVPRPCFGAVAPGGKKLMVTNTKKVINFLSAGLRHQKRAKHGRFRPFRAVPRGLRLRHASKHLKRYNYDFNHLCLRFLLAPDGHLPTEHFWHFWAFLPQMTFLPSVEAVAVGCVFFSRGRKNSPPLGWGLGPLRLSPRILEVGQCLKVGGL